MTIHLSIVRRDERQSQARCNSASPHLTPIPSGSQTPIFPPVERKPQLLDHVRTAIRVRYDSPRTEDTYAHWIKRVVFSRCVRVACLLLVVLACELAASGSAWADCAADNGCWCGDGNCPTLGCCGEEGQRVCLTTAGISDCPSACAPGLHYNGSTTHCELPCSYGTTVFGACCGDVGQPSCAGIAPGVNFDCKDGLRFQISKGTCQPFDSSCTYCQSTLGNCCGGDGDPSCAGTGDQASGADCNFACADGLAFNGSTCELIQTAYSHDDTADTDNSDWMASVPSSRLLGQISIPGTHDTGSVYSSDITDLTFGLEATLIAGGATAIIGAFCPPCALALLPAAAAAPQILEDMVYTQSLPLAEQLKAGIRYWDIRLAFTDEDHSASTPVADSSLGLFHGTFNQNKDFDVDVMQTAVTFLQAHPTETVIMALKQENVTPGFGDDRDFSNFDLKLQAILSKYPDYVYVKPASTTWTASTAYAARDVVVDSNGDFQQAQNSGISGEHAPEWSTFPARVDYETGCTGEGGTWSAATATCMKSISGTCTVATETQRPLCVVAGGTWTDDPPVPISGLTSDGTITWSNVGPGNPRLADMRGKVVVVSSYTGIYGLDDLDSDDQGIADNDYIMNFLGDVTRKWGLVADQMDAANSRGSLDRTIYRNYTSAEGLDGDSHVGFPYFFASGHTSNGTDTPRLATGLTRGVIDTCGDYDWCDGHEELPCVAPFLGTCSVLYDGLNHMTHQYLTDATFLSSRQPANGFKYVGIVLSDYPGHGLIDAIIAVNSNTAGNTPPEARCKNITVDAGASCTAAASIDNGSSDADGDVPSCVPSPAGPYGLGATGVTLTCTDFAGATASCTGTVTVADHTGPSLSCPSSLDIECSGNQSANPFFLVATADNCTANPSPSCTPPSGVIYALGSTSVGCQASDAAGNPGSCSFSVNVKDTLPPSIQCPAAQTVECTGGQQASASFSATASDVCWGSLTPQCTPSSGSSFPLGVTSVTCDATDGSGHPAACGSQVSVVDTTPPSIICPADIAVDPTSPAGTVVTFAASATDVCDATPQVACSPVSGTTFGVGTQTSVGCTATDVSLNQASCSFGVKVFSPQEVVANLLARATALGASGALNQGQTTSLQAELQNILAKIQNGPSGAACGQLRGLASMLNDWVQDGTLAAADAQPLLTSLANLQATLGCR